ARTLDTVPSGVSSVMPQAWTMLSPSLSYAAIKDRGAAEPPHTMRLTVLRSYLPDCSNGRAAIQIVGTPAPRVTFSSCANCSTRSGARELPGKTCLAPTNVEAYGRPQALA